MRNLKLLKILNSPFRRPKIKFYFGKIQHGVPYFLPRKWVKSKDSPGYKIPKRIKWFGFNSCGLGWKTKWSDTDYRFEHSPVFSFVFLKKQFCIFVLAPIEFPDEYWEGWLYYYYNTNKTKSKIERLEDCEKNFPLISTFCNKERGKEIVYFYRRIVKEKYLKYLKLN